MSDETVRPALTPEEWKLLSCETPLEKVALGMDASMSTMLVVTHRTETGATLVGTRELHAVAALALHGQPFGFTWKDVALLRRRADREEEELAMHGARGTSQLRSLADRIAALLSPETP